MDDERIIAFAEKLAARARQITLPFFRAGVASENKADDSPVTEADRRCEREWRDMIAAAYPTHGVVGEEYGDDAGGAAEVWVLDPIDGTRSFISGSPLYCSLIALVRDGTPVVGVIDAPALGERWVGYDAPGRQWATFCGRACRVAEAPLLAQARMISTTLGLLDNDADRALRRLAAAAGAVRLGGDGTGYGCVAAGFAHLAADYEMAAYDYLPLLPIVRAAGGEMSDWHGQPLSLANGKTTVLASASANLHQHSLTALNDRPGH